MDSRVLSGIALKKHFVHQHIRWLCEETDVITTVALIDILSVLYARPSTAFATHLQVRRIDHNKIDTSARDLLKVAIQDRSISCNCSY